MALEELARRRLSLSTEAANPTKWAPQEPTPKQAEFLGLTAREAFYGGAAGGGKSSSLLMSALENVHIPGYAALLLRRTYADLSLPGALMDRANDWLRGTAAKWMDKEKTWLFPSGATVTFGYLETENNKYRYQGAEFQFIGFDELVQFTESMYLYLFSRLRRLKTSDVPLKMRSASNPGGLGHDWVRQRFIVEGNDDRVFVPAKLGDNPYLDEEEYRQSLAELDPVTRQQLLEGDWEVRPAGGFFKAAWFARTQPVAPANAKRIRAWDLAATADGDWTAGILMSEQDGTFYIEDVKRGRWTPNERDAQIKATAQQDGTGTTIWIEEEGGSAGKAQSAALIRMLAGYTVHTEHPTGPKETRAGAFASQAEGGNVVLIEGPWTGEYLRELLSFGSGAAHDDQVDATSLAFGKLASKKPFFFV